MNVIRLLIADDQALVRGGLAALLSLEADLEVVAETGRHDEVLPAVREHRPDVCLLDIEMPGAFADVSDGIDVAALLSREEPQVRSLIVTTFGRPGYLRRAMESGAAGFVVKDTPATELAEAVRKVYAGHHVVDPALATESLTGGANPLTAREQEILRVASRGAPVAEIAAAVHLSPGTVRNYLSSAIAKTATANRIEAASAAQRHGWL